MRRQLSLLIGFLPLATALLAGCSPQQPFFFHPDKNADISHYVSLTTELEYPDLKEVPNREAENSSRPFSLANSEAKEIWDLTLEAGHPLRPAQQQGDALDWRQSSVGPAVASPVARRGAHDLRSGHSSRAAARGGVEAALAAFDAQLASSLYWNKNRYSAKRVACVLLRFSRRTSAPSRTPDSYQDDGTWPRVRSPAASILGAEHHCLRLGKRTARLSPHAWTTNFAGAGARSRCCRAPAWISTALPARSHARHQQRRGARPDQYRHRLGRLRDRACGTWSPTWRRPIGNCISPIATWMRWWPGRNSALQTWRRIHALYVVGAAAARPTRKPRPANNISSSAVRWRQALNSLYVTESKLRYMMGLAATDGRLIRPGRRADHGQDGLRLGRDPLRGPVPQRRSFASSGGGSSSASWN